MRIYIQRHARISSCKLAILGLALIPARLPIAAEANAAPVKGMASTVGLYVYPRSHQTASQQLTDESQCYSNAKSDTGYDPNATTTATKTQPAEAKGNDKSMAKGAARGAILSGATGGDAAAGARRGAILGGIKEKRKDKQADEQAQQQAAASHNAQQPVENFKKSLSACLDARGYSVK